MGFSLKPLGRKFVDIFSADTQEDQRKRVESGQERYYADQQRAMGNNAPATNPAVQARNIAVGMGRGIARIPETVSRSFLQAGPAGDVNRMIQGKRSEIENIANTIPDQAVRANVTEQLSRADPALRFDSTAPSDPLRRFLYGSEPIETYQTRREGYEKTLEGSRFRDVAGPLSALGGIGMAVSDIVPVGPGKLLKGARKAGGRSVLPKVTAKAGVDAGVTPSIASNVVSTRPSVAKTQVMPPVVTPPAALPKVTAKAPTTKVKLNTDRLNLDAGYEGMKRLDKDTAEVIKRMSNDDVVRLAKSAGLDTKTYGVEGTKKKIAEQLNLRQEVVRLQNEAEVARQSGDLETAARLLRESAEQGRVSRSQGTDLARQLQARRIVANELDTPQQKVFKLLDTAGVNPDAYTRRFATVDFKNADDVMRAYRELVPAKFGDWLDKYRYTNMLSSPLTHIVNITSNVTGLAGVAPVQKLVEGGLDAARAAITGGPRTRFAGEAGAYVKGVAQSFPEAAAKFKAILSGKANIEMPDADALKAGRLSYSGASGLADSVLSFIPKLLEASDQFGMTLARGGEKAALTKRAAKGVTLKGNLDATVDAASKYRVFRQALGEPGQGAVLDAIDFIPKQILRARNSKNPIVRTLSKFTIPFVTTPTNLFKQGIEYSPLGVTTILGNADKTAQLAKVTMGSTVVGLAAGAFAAKDGITFAEPTDAKQRDAFRAEGKQPYAIKIGDKWINYSKLHPALAFNFAIVGAAKDARDKGAMSEAESDKFLRTAAGVLGFFRDQSYMKSVGDFTSNLQLKDGSDMEDAFASMGSNYANQLSPFKSMVSWIGRQVDPTQRKTDYDASAPEQIYQNIVKDIPGLNQNVPTRTNPYTGEPLTNDNPTLNAFSPLRVTNDKGFGTTTGLSVEQRQVMQSLPEGEQQGFRQEIIDQKFEDKQAKKEQDQFKKETSGGSTQLSNGKIYTKVGDEYKTFDTEDEAKLAVAKHDFKQSGETIKEIGDNVFRRNKDGTTTVTSKIKYDSGLTQNKLQAAKRADNLDEWFKLADAQYKNLQEQLQDPTLDDLEKSDVQEKIDVLLSNAEKYQEYGGFTKGKGGGKKGTKTAGSAYKYAVSLRAGGEPARPKVSARKSGGVRSTLARGTARPKVSLKKSRV